MRTWVFDLDNTLHDADPHIFPHINRSMTEYLQRELGLDEAAAGELRRHYWLRYGATLLGLMRHHATDPAHFLRETHRFPELHRMVCGDPPLRAMLRHALTVPHEAVGLMYSARLPEEFAYADEFRAMAATGAIELRMTEIGRAHV